MEKVRLTLINGVDVVVVHTSRTDLSFDDLVANSDSSFILKAEGGMRIPLRSILTYQHLEAEEST